MNQAASVQVNPDIELPKPQGAVTTIDAPANAVAVSDTAALLQMIDRATRDPAVDVEKAQKLMDLYERVDNRNREQQFDISMNAAQRAMEQVRTDADNPSTKSRYASYAALDRAIRPMYTAHGFSISFNTREDAPADTVRVTCQVSHAGYSRNYLLDIPADGKGARGGDVMTKTHATMAAVTYGKRGLLGMVFNIAVARDDDGNAAGTLALDEDQVTELLSTITEINLSLQNAGSDLHVDLDKLCKRLKVSDIRSIPATKLPTVIGSLKQWAKGEVEKAERKPGGK